MHLFPYRKENDQELIVAARAAYREAPPQRNTGNTAFAAAVHREAAHHYDGPADAVPRADAA